MESENPEQLAERIRYILDNSEEAKAMGGKAREKCIKKYSWDAMEKMLVRVFEKYE